MHDINKIRNNADFFIKGWQRRGLDVNLDTILALDKDLRKSITDLQDLQTQRNDLSKICLVKHILFILDLNP